MSRKSSNCNMVVYFALITITFISLFSLRKEMDYNYSIFFYLILGISTFASLIFFLMIKNVILKKDEHYYSELSTGSNNSGNEQKNELSLVDESLTNIKLSDNIQFNKTDGIFDKIKYEKGMIVINDINKPVDDIEKNFDFSKDKQADFSNSQKLKMLQELEKHNKFVEFCDTCKIFKNLRTKHCKKCGKCIDRYDHHCFYFDLCIGERNQKVFFFFLIFQSVSLFLIVLIDFDTMSNFLNKTNEDYFKIPFILYPLILMHIGYFLISTIFLILHMYLISTGQTTNEFLRKNSIRYISLYKELKTKYFGSRNERIRSNVPYNPFDFGLITNFRMFFSSRKIDWFEEYKKNLVSLQKRFNLCENEYWSCF